MTGRLPRGVDLLLRRLLPGDLADPIAGDLLEEYLVARDRRGDLRATAWVWAEALRLAALFRWERVACGRGVPPIAEELRAVTGFSDDLRRDVMFSARMLRRQPGFTLVALVALALGIGANTAVFSVVDAVLWRPLPFPDAGRAMQLAEQRPRESRWFGPVAPADFFDWQRDTRSFASLAAWSFSSPSGAYNLTGAGEPERIQPLKASPSFLAVLGLRPALGRDFRPEEEIVGRHRVVLLSDGFWRRRFGGDRAVLGRTVAFDGHPFEIVGVLPAAFWWPTHPDVVVPLALSGEDKALRGAHFLNVVGRLRDGVSPAQARDDLGLIGARLAQRYPAENANHAPNLRPLREALVGDVRQALLVLLGAVAFVMLIACANVATLLLARAASRRQELSVRRAVGASRRRIAQQMLTESVVVAFLGGAAGVLVAAGALAAFRRIAPVQFAGLPGVERAGIDVRVLLAAVLFSAITAAIFGIAPALISSDAGLGAALADATRSSSAGVRAQRLRSALVVIELALSIVLLVGAALLIVSFRNVLSVSPGFQPSQLVIARISLPAARYGEHGRVVAFFDALYDRLRGAAGVEHVAATTSLPFDGLDSRLDLRIENRDDEFPFPIRADPRLVSTDYFRTMGIPLIRGRIFSDRDAESSPNVVVVNEAAARRYWAGRDPIGRRISLGARNDWRQIVGIVGDTRHEGLDADAEPAAFLPQQQRFTSLGAGFERTVTLILRTDRDSATVTPALRAAVASVDAELPVGLLRPMDDVIGESVAPRRLNFLLVSAFAAIAMGLTATGLYGVMAYLVAQRTREIGVRMALGASRPAVLLMMLREAGAMTATGIAVGLAGARALSRFLATLLFGVSATEPMIYVAVALLLAAVALVAVLVPSSRATRVDPLVVLRES
ncbi:MAG TPA: ABC transporter permease [Vicinamibacterales bacterium]|nr:ABC transporter permease [Vicinamibacterales bacterium]